MTPIRTQRLVLRNWEERDRELFHRINSDEQVMEFFPFRRDRTQADVFFDELREDIAERGWGFSAVEIAATGECVGFVGLNPQPGIPTAPECGVEIGWRLIPEHWGKGYATEAATAFLRFGFDTLGLQEIISFAVWNNHRSIAVMERLGMSRDVAGNFDHPEIPDTHPHLRRFVLYRLKRSAWRGNEKGG